MFMIYGGSSAYFSYYVHTVNREAASMFFTLNNRAIYAASAALFLKEAIGTGNKVLMSRNTSNFACCLQVDGDGKMYLLDVMDQLLTIESACSNFQKHGSRWVYGGYLPLADRADGSEFCAISDSYNYSQTLRTIRLSHQ